MSNRFQRERAARALAARFVLLKVRTDDRKSWGAWTSKYKYNGKGLPLVFVVRADGKQIYGKAGAPRALPQFLALALRKSGKILSRGQLVRLNKSADEVKKLIDDSDVTAAAAILSRPVYAGSFAEPAVRLQKMAAELTEQGNKVLAEAQKKLEKDPADFEAALELVKTDRQYGRLPALRKPINLALRDARKDAKTRPLIDRAEDVDKARAYEDDKNKRQALVAWKMVLTKHPGTAAAKLAQERIEALEAGGDAGK